MGLIIKPMIEEFAIRNFVDTCIKQYEYVSSTLATTTEYCYSTLDSTIGVFLFVGALAVVGFIAFKVIQG